MPIIPNSKRTREELQEMGRKGGIASGRTRRRRRILREYAREVSQIYFIDLFELSRIMGINNPAALEWLLIEMVSGLRKEHRENLITMESLLAMGFSPDRAQNILDEYRKQAAGGSGWNNDQDEEYPEGCAGATDEL